MLDDSDGAGLDDETLERVRTVARDVLDRTRSGAVTIRLLPADRAPIGTVVADEGDGLRAEVPR